MTISGLQRINKITGKHIIFDIKKIKQTWALKSNYRLKQVLDVICEYNKFEIVEIMSFDKTLIYILNNSSHITLQSFPESNYLSVYFHIYEEYENTELIDCNIDFLVQAFDANPLWSSVKVIE